MSLDVSDPYELLVEELMSLLRGGFGGSSRPDFVAKIGRITREIERAGGYETYIQEKAAGVRGWVEIACSQRKHKDWGLDRVEHFTFEDAYKLKGARSAPLQATGKLS